MLPYNQFHNNNSLMKEVWDVESNRYCAECLKPLDPKEEISVLLDPAVILLCSECNQVHLSKKAQEAQNDVQQKNGRKATFHLSEISQSLLTKDQFEMLKIFGKKEQERRASFPIWLAYPTPKSSMIYKDLWINTTRHTEIPKQPVLLEKSIKVKVKGLAANEGVYVAGVQNKNTLVVTNEKLDSDKTTVPINYIESYILDDQSSQFNVHITWRVKNDLNNVKVMCLYTEDFESAYNLACLISYFKETVYMDLLPEITSEQIKKFLNFDILNTSIIMLDKTPRVLKVTEARVLIYEKADDQPEYHIPICKKLNLTATDYLEKICKVHNYDSAKLPNYQTWISTIQKALDKNKLELLPEIADLPEPVVPEIVLKKKQEPPKNTSQGNGLPYTEGSSNLYPYQNNNKNSYQPKSVTHNCYPAIGPMGEMGKEMRGEISPSSNLMRPGTIKQPETNCYPPIQGPPDIINGGLKLQSKSINPMTGQAIQFPTHMQSGLIGNQQIQNLQNQALLAPSIAVPQQQLLDSYALRSPWLYNLSPHLQTPLTSLDANTLLQEQLMKQKLHQQQSQLMQNLNPQLYTQLNIGGLSGLNQHGLQPPQDLLSSLGQNSLLTGSISPGLSFDGITGNGLMGVNGIASGVNVSLTNTVEPTASLANDLSKISLANILPSQQPKMIKANVFNKPDEEDNTDKILIDIKWDGVCGALKGTINNTVYDPSNPPDNLKDFAVKDSDFHEILKALFEHICKSELEYAVTLFRHTLKTFKYINIDDIQRLYDGNEFDVMKKLFYFAGFNQLKSNKKWAIQQLHSTATKSPGTTNPDPWGTQLNGGNDWNKQSLIGNGSDSNDIWSMNAQPQQRSNLFSNNAWGQPPKRSTSLHYEPTIGSGRPSRQATQSVTDIMGNSNASSSRTSPKDDIDPFFAVNLNSILRD